MLEVRELSKRFGANQAVSSVSFQVHPGDAFGLLGPNGAGKSTTISMITGLIGPDEGDIELNGQSLRTNPNYVKQRIGLVPQSIALYENLNAKENLEFWGTVYGISGHRLRDNLRWSLEVAGLTDHAKQTVKNFSGGMKRRLNIAVGMIHRPEILIMDEPTVGIDPQSRNHILDTVRHLNETGMTVIYTSHYMEEVQFLCKRMAIMDHGQLIAYGTLDQVQQLAGSLATITIDVSGDVQPVVQILAGDPVLAALHEGNGNLVIQSRDAASAVSKVVLALAEHRLQPTRIDVQEPNLETAFLHLTGRQLRDKEEGVDA